MMVLRKIDRVIKKVEKFLSTVSWIVAILISLLIVIDVFLRFVFNHPLPATWEMSEVFMPLIVFLPFAHTLAIDAHVRVSLIKDRVPPQVRVVFEVFSNTISFVMCAMITYWSWLRFWESFKINEEILAAIWIPWWIGKGAMPLAFGVFAIRFLIFLLFNLSGQQYKIEEPADTQKYVT
jgi:TRAP-type C4-dicarboxylate transport system permease small subunit